MMFEQWIDAMEEWSNDNVLRTIVEMMDEEEGWRRESWGSYRPLVPGLTTQSERRKERSGIWYLPD